MILSTVIDEVLFWREIDLVMEKIRELTAKFYPHDPEGYFAGKDRFYLESIGSKEEFCRRLALYREEGAPRWITSRTGYMDDLSDADLQIAYKNAAPEEAAARVTRMRDWRERASAMIDRYTSAIFGSPSNQVLELTIGAGSGTHILMEKMGKEDSYVGVDIDFRCAKTADGMGKYYGVNALGMCCNLWQLPFGDGIFSAVCSHNGINECREVPAILEEAARVLRPGGKLVLICGESGYLHPSHKRVFDLFGFDREEAEDWLQNVRLYANIAQLDGFSDGLKLTKTAFHQFDGGRVLAVYTK